MATQKELMLRLSSLVGEDTLFRKASYRRYWLSEQFGSIAFSALIYTLFLMIAQETGSSFFSSLFAATYIGPAALLVTVSGALVDRLPKREVLVASYLAWAALAAGFAMVMGILWAVYLLAVVFAMVSQVKGAAGSSARPLLVPKDKLDRATALGQFGGLIAQVIGVLILPFVFLHTLGAAWLAALCVPLFLAAAYQAARITKIGGRVTDVRKVVSGSREHFMEAWSYLAGERTSYVTMWLYILTSVISYVVITLVPAYASDILGVPKSVAVFIAIPAAGGIWLALRFDHLVIRRLGPLPSVIFGFAGLTAGVIALGFTGGIARVFAATGVPLGADALPILIAMVLAVITGFSYMFINVTDNAIINARIPHGMQGRVFSGQNVLANLSAVPPILLAGITADQVGVSPVFVVTGSVCAGIAFVLLGRHGVQFVMLERAARGDRKSPGLVPNRPTTPQEQVGPGADPEQAEAPPRTPGAHRAQSADERPASRRAVGDGQEPGLR